jgi:ATP-dependent helicase/nuclease subunit A
MTIPDPHLAQRRASDPGASIFVTANAGSGKTTTLVNRVARLLLAGALPEAILCVTYTKAAAAEMQRRLFEQLGGWSVRADEDLRGQLAPLQGLAEDAFDQEYLSRARALFARALETPGGLKIQTIHAFCEKLLKRFPLEAAVSPGFKVMDDADAAEIVAEARATVAAEAMKGAGPVADAYARLSIALAYDDFQSMFAAFEDRRAAIEAYIDRCGGLGEMVANVWRRCGFDGLTSAQDIENDALCALDPDAWRASAGVLAAGTATDGKCAAALTEVAAALEAGTATFTGAMAALFTEKGAGTPAAWVGKTSGLKTREDLRQGLLGDQDMLGEARERARAARVAEDTVHVLTLARIYGRAYEAAKTAGGALDFADLILKTSELLNTRQDAAWVLFKLDGGIDHILVDEAQDTAPEQWRILTALTSEFFAGAGAVRMRAALERTLFIVGDEKQSIYSFQGADPARLRIETDAYHDVIQGAGRQSAVIPLITSFRSTPQVLGFVDAVFADPEAWRGVPPPSGAAVVRHLTIRENEDGCVDIWPLEREEAGEERDAWTDPLDAEGPRSANRRLAERIATEIEALVARGDCVMHRGVRRGAHFGDVLILVRRRKALFEEILRALKRRKVPVAGADRLSLSQHIAFDDLAALARFIQFPADDLTLAALLKSPFMGLDEASLFDLAYGRGKIDLWTTLQARATERSDWRGALAFLNRARAEAKGRRPFDFFSRLLGFTDDQGRSVRARILTRLGAEAQDVLDEFLAQVLEAERRGVADLEQLIADFAKLDITVKREMEGARGEVRVMTVHGAKGLEAPIVFLPETTVKRGGRGSPLLPTEDGGFLWAASSKQDSDASKAAREWRARKDEEETQRLFYVALTRARDRLILCGRINARDKLENVGGWYAAAGAAFGRDELAAEVRTIDVPSIGAEPMSVRRFGPDPGRATPYAAGANADAALPAWAVTAAGAETALRYASPSRLGDEEADLAVAASPLAQSGGLGRYRRGDLIHKLLQLLPDFAPSQREDAARRMLARERDLTDDQRAEMAAAALGVLNDPQFAAVFGPGSRAEVAVAGLAPGAGRAISGRVDRLLVEKDRVLVVDFKTNRPAPASIEQASQAYIDQMAVYAAVLQSIFPERRIEAALVWTDGPRLMAVPENLTAKALAGLAQSVDS